MKKERHQDGRENFEHLISDLKDKHNNDEFIVRTLETIQVLFNEYLDNSGTLSVEGKQFALKQLETVIANLTANEFDTSNINDSINHQLMLSNSGSFLPILETPGALETIANHLDFLSVRNLSATCRLFAEKSSRNAAYEAMEPAKLRATKVVFFGCSTLIITHDGNFIDIGQHRNSIARRLTRPDHPCHVFIKNHLYDISEIVAYESSLNILLNDGVLYSWGHNKYGVLGHGNDTPVDDPEQLQLECKPAEVKCIGRNIFGAPPSTIVVMDNNFIYTWGDNTWSDYTRIDYTGGGNTWSRSYISPKLHSNFHHLDITDTAIGYNFFLALTADGKVYTSSNNNFGQRGADKHYADEKCTQVAFDPEVRVTKIVAGSTHAMALDSNNRVYYWAYTDINNHRPRIQFTPTLVDLPKTATAVDIKTTMSNCFILTDEGNVFTCEVHSVRRQQFSPTKVIFDEEVNIQKLDVNYNRCIAISDDFKVYGWVESKNYTPKLICTLPLVDNPATSNIKACRKNSL